MSTSSGDKAKENQTLFADAPSQDVGGASLRAHREAAGIEIADIAADLRIPKAYLEALETEQHDILPGETYGQGYIKSYCKYLNIDAAPYLDKFKMQMSRYGARPDYHFPDEVLEPRMSGAMISMLLVLVLLSGYIGWQVLDRFDLNPLTSSSVQTAQVESRETVVSASDDDADIQIEAPQSEAPTSQASEETASVETELAESEDSLAVDSQNEDASAPVADEPENVANEEPVAVAETAEEPADVVETPSAQPAVQTQTAVVEDIEQNANTSSALATAREPTDEIIISAIAPSWVEVVRENGDIVLNKLFKPGDQYVSPADTKLYLSTGNAGGLVLTLPGMSEFNVGQVGEIVRDLPLSRDSLRSRRSALINQ